MNILIVGGLGYIGAHLVQQLALQHQIHIVDTLLSADSRICAYLLNANSRQIQYHRIINDPMTQRKEIAALQIDIMIYCAGTPKSSKNEGAKDAQAWFHAAVAADIRHIILASSAAVYGQALDLPIDESHPAQPISHYGMDKLVTEHHLMELARSHGVHSLNLRIFNLYGGEFPFAHASQTSFQLIDYLIQQIRRPDGYVTIQQHPTKDGSFIRDCLYIKDLMRAIELAVDWLPRHQGHHIMNLGTGIGTSFLEMIRMVEALHDLRLERVMDHNPSKDISQSIANSQRAHALLGWQPQFSLEQGIVSTQFKHLY